MGRVRSLQVFAGVMGTILALALLKFGNPVILDHRVEAPSGFWEFLVWSWPLEWAYPFLALMAVWGVVLVWRHHLDDGQRCAAAGFRRWILWLPGVWLLLQCLSSTVTCDPALTSATLKHFFVLIMLFYAGLGLLSRIRSPMPLWIPLLVGILGVIAVGFDQHFVGFEETRRFVYSQPDWQSTHSAAFLKKLASDRVYSTLFYPNTLAGALVLLTPGLISLALSLSVRPLTKCVLASTVGFGCCACLYWSGSRSGWLIALLMIFVVVLQFRIPKRIKLVLVSGLLIAGVGVFLVRHAAYFQHGATSVEARFEYWKAALQIAQRHPFLGTGPGTFSVLYRYMKSPDAEMARLVHNDYLQQACDSGLLALMVYGAFVAGTLAVSRPRRTEPDFWIRFAAWIGLLAWAIQGFVEFNLYVPAVSWPAFLLMGWLLGCSPATSASPAVPSVEAPQPTK